jgi:prepilin peptidase CpaA
MIEFSNSPIANVSTLTLLCVLAVSTASDLAEHRIPNQLLLPALIIAVGLHLIAGGMPAVLTSLAGLTVGLAFMLPLYLMGGMGAGDVKLLGVAGAFIGPWGVLVAGTVTLIAGAVLALVFVAWQLGSRAVADQAATYMEAHAGPETGSRESNTASAQVRGASFAYAPAISVGVVFAMWQQGLLTALLPTG